MNESRRSPRPTRDPSTLIHQRRLATQGPVLCVEAGCGQTVPRTSGRQVRCPDCAFRRNAERSAIRTVRRRERRQAERVAAIEPRD